MPLPGFLTRQDSFHRAGFFKGLLFLGALILLAALFFTTQRIILDIRDASRQQLTTTVQYYRSLLLRGNPQLAYEVVQEIDFPLVLCDTEGNPKLWKNLSVGPRDTTEVAKKKLMRFIHQMDSQGNTPIPLEVVPGVVDYFHYGDPQHARMLRWLSFSSSIAVALYVLLGYFGFRSIRKSEESSVWVGMARETAHQLGTPISSLMGWLEVLGDKGGEITENMRQDVARLERIAVRFSKIGTTEVRKPADLNKVILDAVEYMRGRVGSLIVIETELVPLDSIPLQVELISWVIENLIRNAAQAMRGEGTIHIRSGKERKRVYIDVRDQGVGIPKKDHEAIFRPGFTTKKRGWGLGLSLAKRIVEETHRGKISVRESKQGEGTTIRVELPL